METKARKFAGIVGAFVICLGLPAFGQIPVQVTLNGPGTALPVTIGTNQEYAGVYSGSASNGTTFTSNPGLICDDFTGQVNPPQTWNALAYQVSTITSATLPHLLYGGALPDPPYPNIGLSGYAALADLVQQSFNSNDPTLQADIGEAIWSITDPAIAGQISANASALRAAALAFGASENFSQFTNLWIFVPNPLTADYASNKQEMWGRVPEGGSALMYLLLAGLFCFGAVYLNSRNRFGTLKV